MIFGIGAGELAWLAGMIVVGGLVTGILAGLFGIGGGAIIVPVLYEVFGVLNVPDEVRMQLCIGTSLAIIVPTTFRSYREHLKRGAVMDEIVRAWWLPAVIGVGTGALIAAFAPGWVFQLAFAVIASVIALRLLIGRDDWRFGDDLPKGPGLKAYGFVVGLCSALMGVSGGSVSNMILTMHDKPILRAVATSAGLGVPITIAGTIGFMLAGLPKQSLMPPISIGFVSLIGFALMAPVSSFTASYGAQLAHALPKRWLEIGFGIFLLVASARFALAILGH
jgi:uncharacterized membrane protein YfcA